MFSLLFLLERRIWIRSLTNGSGPASGRPKNIWILQIRIRFRIRNTDAQPDLFMYNFPLNRWRIYLWYLLNSAKMPTPLFRQLFHSSIVIYGKQASLFTFLNVRLFWQSPDKHKSYSTQCTGTV